MTLPSIKDAEPAEPKPPGPLTVADLRRHVAEREASGERSHAGWQVDLAPKAAWEIRHDPEYQVCVCGGQRPLPGDFFACVHGMYLRANARVSALTVAEIQPMQERRFGDGRELQQRALARKALHSPQAPVPELQIDYNGFLHTLRMRLADLVAYETQSLRDFVVRPRQRPDHDAFLGENATAWPREADIEFDIPPGVIADALVRRVRRAVRGTDDMLTCELRGQVGRVVGRAVVLEFTFSPSDRYPCGWWRFQLYFQPDDQPLQAPGPLF